VHSFLRTAQLGLHTQARDELWLCTTCGQCEVQCPRGVKIKDVIRGLRYLAWEDNQPHSGLPSLLWSVYWNNNPWDQPPSNRSQWAKDLNLPRYNPDKHEILYYVGCSAAYETRAQKIARDLVKLLKAARVSFGILGDDEPCSGEEVLSLGHYPYFQDLSNQALETFRDWGVGYLITTDPHSYDAFRNYYQGDYTGYQVDHYTQYLSRLLEDGRLVFDQSLHTRITFHDPCYLARHNQEINAPRKILSAIPGVEMVEMEQFGKDTICCGGGGGRMWLETDPGERISDLRVTQAVNSGANILATACPYCVTCLEDSLKSQGLTDLVVMDIAEIGARSLGNQG
jgi:Fe-S oxidoreductase